jgi:hypothetical protein
VILNGSYSVYTRAGEAATKAREATRRDSLPSEHHHRTACALTQLYESIGIDLTGRMLAFVIFLFPVSWRSYIAFRAAMSIAMSAG